MIHKIGIRYNNLVDAAVALAEMEAELQALREALWHGAGVAARLEFGDDHKYIDRMQTAVHYEWTKVALPEGRG